MEGRAYVAPRMKRAMLGTTVTAALVGAVWLLWGQVSAQQESRIAPRAGASEPAATAADSLPTLELRALFEPGPKLKPSAAAIALAGKRVRLAGFMAELESPLKGAFYLVPRPVHCDEAGGGTADLPPESVLVTIAWSAEKLIRFVPGAIEATGTFEVGNRADEAGRTSNFRLRLDKPLLPNQSSNQRALTSPKKEPS